MAAAGIWGSLGQSLCEAASGVRHLREVLADLDRQSGELFKPAGRNPTASRLAESYIESKRSIEAAMLSERASRSWKKPYHRAAARLRALPRDPLRGNALRKLQRNKTQSLAYQGSRV